MSVNPKVSYISCIKINGVPILPPVVTQELRKELIRYKRQAVKLEKRLKNCRDLKNNLDELSDIHTERPFSQLTFGDNSHIEALNISDKPGDHEFRTPNLTRDIIEVTQYDDSGMTTICSNVRSCKDNSGKTDLCDSDKIDQSRCSEAEGAKICKPSRVDKVVASIDGDKQSQCYDNEFNKSITSPKPRLIRSNSYTLESPSPILLAHWKKTSCLESLNTDSTSLTSARNWTSLENNHVPFESSDFSSADTVYHNESYCKNNDRSEPASTPDKSAKTINEVKSPTIEVYQTDISVQQITVNTNAGNGLTSQEKSERFLAKNPFEVFEPDCELLNVLKDIPETYANQIIELLRVQHLEQKDRLERYDNLGGSPEKHSANFEVSKSQSSNEVIRKEAMSESENATFTTPSSKTTCDNNINHTSIANEKCNEYVEQNHDSNTRPHTTESFTNSDMIQSEKLRRSSTFSMSPSQSLYYSICSDVESLTVPSSPSIQLIDLESNNGDDLEIGVLREKNGYWEGVMIHENAKNIDCSRELFPEIDPVTMNALKREWAASVIGAHVKGYMTRRLLKTEKVQALIATIKDVLMCAVELHNSDNIDEKDVELHRRLINQLSAALYSFHDTFFDLSIPEQMLIIAADRQRRIEKRKRPQSARTLSRSVSGKSDSSSIKSNRSLPPSRSSSKHKLFSGSPSLTKV